MNVQTKGRAVERTIHDEQAWRGRCRVLDRISHPPATAVTRVRVTKEEMKVRNNAAAARPSSSSSAGSNRVVEYARFASARHRVSDRLGALPHFEPALDGQRCIEIRVVLFCRHVALLHEGVDDRFL
jgi:hypothetical protein